MLLFSSVQKIISPASLPPLGNLLKLASVNKWSLILFRFYWGNLILFLEFFTFFWLGKFNFAFRVLFIFYYFVDYSMSATVACLNFVLALQPEKLLSGLDIPSTQFNCPAALLYNIFSSLDNRLFFSFNPSCDNLVSEMQSM